jgi:hypothetical protein
VPLILKVAVVPEEMLEVPLIIEKSPDAGSMTGLPGSLIPVKEYQE